MTSDAWTISDAPKPAKPHLKYGLLRKRQVEGPSVDDLLKAREKLDDYDHASRLAVDSRIMRSLDKHTYGAGEFPVSIKGSDGEYYMFSPDRDVWKNGVLYQLMSMNADSIPASN